MEAVETTFSTSGSTVTAVDTGVPVGTYEADGSQIDPETNAPYPTGTLLQNDENGFPQPVYTNSDPTPVVTVNTSQTWAVVKEPLRRESLIFNKPTKFGRFHQAIDWVPVNTISAEWGQIQIIVGGVDVTYFRGHPSEMGPWSSNEPNGDAAASVYFPQISWWETPNYGDLTWIRPGKDVSILLVRPDGSRKVLFEGLVVTHVYNGKGVGLGLDILGVLYQADHTPYIQELYKKKRDIGTAIADIMDGAISRHYGACNRPQTGIMTDIRGSGGARLTQGVQDLLSTAWTADTTNQWTITNLSGRRPYIHLKDKTTHHWTMAMGHPGLDLNLTLDFQQMVSMVWGSGIDPDNGGSWFNARYPGIRVEIPPPYPLPTGQVFHPGDSHTGFDEFADELRTRGYRMQSDDTYDADDEDEVRDVQRRAGITIDGIVGAQTWNAIFGVGGNFSSLTGAHIAPLAAITENVRYRERADGSIIEPNPYYNKSLLAIGRLEEYGEVSKKQGMAYAKNEIAPRNRHEPMWVGSATFSMDPENGSRWEMKAGQNLFVKFMIHSPTAPTLGGLLLHMSQVSVTPGGDVTAQLSYLGHDMTTLAALRARNKNTLDPARRTNQSARASKISQDRVIPWDSEAGGGKIQLHNLQGGFWTTFAIPGGEIGIISETLYVCATSLKSYTINNAFTEDGVLSGAKRFCVAIFSKPVTANWMKDVIGDPFTGNKWTEHAVKLEKAGMLQAYGTSDQGAGYWPGQESDSDPVTGKMLDGQSWPWKSSHPPYLFVAEYCASSTRIAGQLRNAPLGT